MGHGSHLCERAAGRRAFARLMLRQRQDKRTVAAEGLPELSAIRFPHNLLSGNKKNPDQHFKQLGQS
tara:strand:+ start:564 stop:764 length:201 start_codon:yes stop_codon:yes gene_type:complete